MAAEVSPHNFPLTALSYKAINLISCLLNSKKVIPSDGPQKLLRDWRGLACLTKISSEVASSFDNVQDKTSKVLELWCQRQDDSATIGKLFEYLEMLDRFDVYDDLQELWRKGELLDLKPAKSEQGKKLTSLEDERSDLITFDDVQCGEPQLYHGYVLSAKEDKDFVDELLRRMKMLGFKICTEADLLPGHVTQYTAVAKLISERCHRIILIYSPDFLNSPANSFYMDYAQAVGIEMRKPKIIPCMFRPCTLPPNLSYYHRLHYTPPGQKAAYDFWDKLAQSLELVKLPRVTTAETTNSALKLPFSETQTVSNGSLSTDRTNFLALPEPVSTKSSASLSSLDTLQVQLSTDDSKSLSDVSQICESRRKKVSPLRKIFNSLKGKKYKEKKAIMVAD